MKLRRYEIVSDTEHLTKEKIEEVLQKKSITDYAYILHDKDTREDGSLKNPHFHILIWLSSSQGSEFVAKWFGVPENFLNKVRHDYSALEYLTHRNAPDKYQYPDEAVTASFDVEETIKESKAAIDKDKRLNEILEKIDSGEYKPFNIDQYITVQERIKYDRQIKIAFDYKRKKIIFESKGERNMRCIYVHGDSGTGKTTWAKNFCEENHYSCYISSGSNDPLDGYDGQDVIILDDLRPQSFGISDLLKMLDNHTASAVKSRYFNKYVHCSYIIITSVLDLDDFFHGVFSKEDEAETIVQLKRRCEMLLHFNMETIDVFTYSKKLRDYTKTGCIPTVALLCDYDAGNDGTRRYGTNT